ncbi:MAG: glutathione S-transferase family protein [Nevskiaceae bacterium]|nr:MAG: glutathione S-transferase family protein [Nevskiaceae bacterium]TBR72512.1 MAG: glutathione S-transferase family protein [Nevskiaceae bacterium]
MKFLQSFGPNPRRVRMYMLEKNVQVPSVELDILGGENRGEAYKKKNPSGQLPALELDDGFVLAETVSICRYLEELHPNPPLIGTTAKERAETDMWIRRVELDVTGYMLDAFRYSEGLKLFENRVRCLPEAAAGMKEKGRDGLKWLDGLLAGKTWLAGNRFTLADILLYCDLDFLGSVGQPYDTGLKNIDAWFKRAAARPSAAASLHAASAQTGMRG